jgi:hypothetical protein
VRKKILLIASQQGGGKEKREVKRTGMGLDGRSNGSIDLIILVLMDEILSIGAAGL